MAVEALPGDTELLPLAVSDVRQHVYCPRIPYFRLGLRLAHRPVTVKMRSTALEGAVSLREVPLFSSDSLARMSVERAVESMNAIPPISTTTASTPSEPRSMAYWTFGAV